MSVTFFGRKPDGQIVAVDGEDAAHLNMSSANARAFLLFLGLDPGTGPDGEVAIPEGRRAIMRARATFERRVRGYPREATDTRRPGCVRVIEGGLDVEYFERRLDDFQRFVDAVVERGAASICWA
jgi:hypothetical protein